MWCYLSIHCIAYKTSCVRVYSLKEDASGTLHTYDLYGTPCCMEQNEHLQGKEAHIKETSLLGQSKLFLVPRIDPSAPHTLALYTAPCNHISTTIYYIHTLHTHGEHYYSKNSENGLQWRKLLNTSGFSISQFLLAIKDISYRLALYIKCSLHRLKKN